jgi:hypothetical protein
MFTKERLGWEEVQLLDLTGIRTLVALSWVATGFLHELVVTLEWPEVHLKAHTAPPSAVALDPTITPSSLMAFASVGENLRQAGYSTPDDPASRFATGFHLLSRSALAAGGLPA